MAKNTTSFDVGNMLLVALRMSLVAVIALFFSSQQSDAKLYKRFKVNAWKGGIYTDNKTGEFSHCVASAKYKSGITLFFSVTRTFNWQVGFSKPSWKLTVGNKYPVRYQVDRHKVFSGKARAVTKVLAVVKLPAKAKLFNQMRRGRLLKVKAGDDLLKFKLTSTKKLLSRLLRCAKRNKYLVVNRSLSSSSSGSGSDNPFDSGDNTATRTQPKRQPKRVSGIPAAHRREARQWFDNTLANTLSGSGASYRVIRNEGKAAKYYKKYAIVWRVGKNTGIIGSLQIIPNRKPEGLMNKVRANEARICKGDFASRSLKDDIVSSNPITRLLVSCNLGNGKQWNAYFAITDRDQGGAYLVTLLTSKASADEVLQAGDKISGSMQIVSTTTSRDNVEDDDLPDREDDDKVVTY